MLDMGIYHSHLTDRAVLRLSGPDRVDFLQNLVTQNVARPQSGSCVMAALLTPQGKLLYDFFIFIESDCFLLDCDAAIAAALLKKLSLYKLRADVTIAETALAMHALWQEDGFPCPPQVGFYTDPRAEALGLRGFFDTAPDTKLPSKPLDDWHMNRLKSGVPQGPLEMPPGTVFPLEYGMAERQAIDFKKGCFVGQEVTSRTHRKGALRKKLQAIQLSAADGQQGDALMAGERVGGELVARRDHCGLALIREDAIAEKLTLNGAAIEISAPHA
ncbi:MAG: folate-binding protein [Alphaproteobacteria bacterium]|nr:folate-binding protein [Alphaproteobacteria bacterium]